MSVAINQRLGWIEGQLNRCGHIPGVSTVTGPARGIFGVMELTAGCMLAMNHAEQKTSAAEGDQEPAYYIIHGAANIGRGCVETAIGVGNVATFLYDFLGFRHSYKHENDASLSFREVKELPGLVGKLIDERMARELSRDLVELFGAIVDLLPVSQLSTILRVQIGIFRIGSLLLPIILQEQRRAISSLRGRLGELSTNCATVFGGNHRIWRSVTSIALIFFRPRGQKTRGANTPAADGAKSLKRMDLARRFVGPRRMP